MLLLIYTIKKIKMEKFLSSQKQKWKKKTESESE